MRRLLFLLLILIPLSLISYELDPDVLIYGDTVQVNSGLDEYENIVAGTPIRAFVMITHDANRLVDLDSFAMGNKPLKVELIKSEQMSSARKLVVSIYRFQIAGLKTGIHTLPPIKVKVGGKEYQAPPLIIQVG